MTPNEQPSARKHWQILLLAFGAFILVFVLWQVADNTSPILYPFRLLVTFVHESGHGLSAVLTGGQFLKFTVFQNGAGVATTGGGNRFIVLQMGYLGAALFGAVLLYAANRTRRVQLLTFALGAFFIGCALLFTGSGSIFLVGVGVALVLWLISGQFKEKARLLQIGAAVVLLGTLILVGGNIALIVGIVAGALLIALGAYASRPVTIFVLNVLALIVGFDAINDILGLWNNQSARLGNTPNDALAVAQLTNTPVQFWILLWIGLVLVMMGASLYFAFIRPARRAASSSNGR
jgi:hypothetical protein